LFTQQKCRKNKQNETSIKRKEKKGFVGVSKSNQQSKWNNKIRKTLASQSIKRMVVNVLLQSNHSKTLIYVNILECKI
jgi:hypothetical protein